MGGGAGLLACSCRAGDGVNADVMLQQVEVGSGQQCQLYGGGKAAGVGKMLRLSYLVVVYLGQAVHVVVTALDAEVLSHVDNLHTAGYGVLLQKLLALAVAEAEKHHVHLVEGHLVGEQQVGVANQSFMHIRHRVAGVAL